MQILRDRLSTEWCMKIGLLHIADSDFHTMSILITGSKNLNRIYYILET